MSTQAEWAKGRQIKQAGRRGTCTLFPLLSSGGLPYHVRQGQAAPAQRTTSHDPWRVQA